MTPIKDLDVTGANSKISSGTFSIQSGVIFQALAGSTVDLSAATLTLGTNQVLWTKVSKSGSSLLDLATRSASDINSGTLATARLDTGTASGKVVTGGVITAGTVGSTTAIPVLTYNAAGQITAVTTEANAGSSGATTFLALTDTPSSYPGQGGKHVAVNAGATALEFVTASGGSFTWASVPATNTAIGTAGDLAYDSSYIYLAIATNSWRRVALSALAFGNFTSTYVSDGDANGVLNFVGKNLDAAGTWTNPHTAGRVTVSSNGDNSGGDIKATIVDRMASSYSTAVGGWIQIDLGSGRTLTLNKYSYRYRNDGSGYAPTAWTFAGSNDGTIWTTVDTRTGLTPTASAWVSTSVAGQSTGYRYWRLTQTGNNNNGTSQLSIGELELYGAFAY